jgi:hypothetical protein
MIIIMIGMSLAKLALLSLITVQGRKCTISEDLKMALTECDPITHRATAFFYYDKEDKCDTEVLRDLDSGQILTDGSDPLPPYFSNYDCNHKCENSGEFSTIKHYPTTEQVCQSCPSNSIAVQGGFIIDGLMDDESHLQRKISQHLTTSCTMISTGDLYDPDIVSMAITMTLDGKSSPGLSLMELHWGEYQDSPVHP